ncbi:p450 domain containing protein, partial [Asbolus verrucosus]
YLAFKLPGPPALPFLGHVHLIYNNRTLEDLGTKMSELYGPIMKCWVSILPFFFITEPEDLQVILSANKCSTKNIFYTFLHNFIGEGLITNTDTVLGISPDNSVETTPFRKGKVFILYRVARPWLLVDTIFRITNISQSESKQQEVLQDYTKAGQDSVGAALAFSLYFLAVHQDVQNNVLEELNSIFGNTDRLETFEDVIKMKYLEQCIKETMRLCPSVPMFCRRLTEDVPIGKYVFPAGTNLFISPFVTHRLPHIFPDPLKFDPERFSPENISKVHPYAYIPFSAGPRNCI